MGDDERVAYLGRDDAVGVPSGERADLDGLRELLADPALWIQPDPTLEDRIVGAIASARPEEPTVLHRRHWIRNTLLGVAAALVLVVGVVSGLRQSSSAPVTFAAELHGTPLAAGASGSATLTKTVSGWQIKFHGGGLPRRASGLFYQAWLTNSSGLAVPIGTFNQPADVTLWAGVPPTDFPVVEVSRGQIGATPATPTQVVLVGTAHATN
jgi:hypothetical protein